MSTDQPTLGESIDRKIQQTRERARVAVDGRGALYGRSESQPDADTKPVPKCLGCGRTLADLVGSPQRAREVARVVGDNDGHIPGCDECIELQGGNDVVSTVRAAQLARGERR